MPDITIPDAAMEAAAHAMFEVTGEPDWTAMEIRQVVEAAAPYIAAQALRDAVTDMVWDLPRYRDARVMILQRADRIENGRG